MRLASIPLLLAGVTLPLAAPLSAGHAQVLNLPPHPRLIVYGTADNPTRLEDLRAQVDETGNPQEWSDRKKALVLAFRSLRAGAWTWYELNLEAEWGERPVRQDEQYRCLTALALTDLLMKDKGAFYPEYADGRIYAQKANAFLHWWCDHGFHNWGQSSSPQSTLGYGELLAGYAFFYDWCYDYLSPQERAYHARSLYRLLTSDERLYIFSHGDWRQHGFFDNNHVGVIMGAAGLAALALDQDDPVFGQTAQDSIAYYRIRAATRVRDYLDIGFPDGACIEGILYAMYGLNLALPYALATQRLSSVTQGFDPLPPTMRVDVPREAFQVSTWLYYEQLPYNPSGGTPLNDTARPPYDINAGFRAWPWLMALSTEAYPNLAVPFFQTIYPPATIDLAVEAQFDYQSSDPINDPFDVREPTGPDPECSPGSLNSVGILLGWPESDSYPTLDPADLPPGAYFPGRGISYFRTGVQLLDPDGTLDWNPDSCLITFECRQHPTEPPWYTHWWGHMQQDVNHFTLFFARQPLFYDSGYAGWGESPSFFSCAHSLHEIRIGGGTWEGFRGTETMGVAIGSVIGSGYGPSFAGGINTECWEPANVVRSVRRMVVLPRPGDPAPYFFLHDDFELAAAGGVRAIMQTGNEYDGGFANEPLLDGNVARWDREEARAVLAFLSPQGMTLATPHLAPNDTLNWPTHWLVEAEVPTAQMRHQIVSMVEPRFVSAAGSELIDATFTIPTSDPEGLAYQIDSGRLTDVVAFRPYDSTEDWWIYPQGYPPIGAEQATVIAMRFDESGSSPETLCAGLLSGGGRLFCDGCLVAALSGDHASTLSFSEAGVSIWSDGGKTPECVLNGISPTAVVVNGEPAPRSTIISGDLIDPSRIRLEEEEMSDWMLHIPNPLRIGDQIVCSGGSVPEPITIGVYGVSGRLLRIIGNGAARGDLRVAWDGRTSVGSEMQTGLYFFRIRQGDSIRNRGILVLR